MEADTTTVIFTPFLGQLCSTQLVAVQAELSLFTHLRSVPAFIVSAERLTCLSITYSLFRLSWKILCAMVIRSVFPLKECT